MLGICTCLDSTANGVLVVKEAGWQLSSTHLPTQPAQALR